MIPKKASGRTAHAPSLVPKKCAATLSKPTPPTLPNPALLVGVLKREFYSAGVVPVYGGYYSYIDQISSELMPPQWRYLKDSETIATSSGIFHNSLKLRYAYKALLTIQNDRPDYIIRAATVDFRSDVSDNFSKSTRGAANAYGDNLRKRLNRLNPLDPVYFIAVVEEKAEQLHAHLILLHHKSLTEEVKECLKRETDEDIRNAVSVKLKFKRNSRAKAGSVEAELEELDREEGLSNFPFKGVKGYYNVSPVDAGWFDYLAKALHIKSNLIADHRHFYIPREVRELTQKLYEQAREEYISGINAG